VENNDHKLNQKGFSTLEMLIAMFILILALTAVVSVSFGNQSIIVDSRTNAEALNIAQSLLEKAQADSRKDFNLVNPAAATTTADGFKTWVDVEQKDYFTKLVTAHVEFPEDSGRRGETKLTAIVTNFNNAVGGDTCNSAIAFDWVPNDHPVDYKMSSVGILSGSGLPDDNYPITNMDAYQKMLYVAASDTATSTDHTLFIFDISNPVSPVYKGSIDNSTTTVKGINAVKVAGNYAYIASARNIAVTDPNFGQLQIFDISNPAVPILRSSFPVPGVNGSSGQGIGKSIFYKNGYVYLGLSKTGSGPEFNIIDVHKFPEVPPTLIGSYSVRRGVESIYVRGNYAYLGTDDDGRELTVLDIHNSQAPVFAGYFSMGAGRNGKSLCVVGDNLYLGSRYVFGHPEFNITSIAELSQTSSTSPLGYKDISDPFSVNGIIVRNALAFVLTGSGSKGGNLQLFNIVDPGSLADNLPVATVSLPVGGGSGGTALDCESDYVYIGSVDGSGKSHISIITGQ